MLLNFTGKKFDWFVLSFNFVIPFQTLLISVEHCRTAFVACMV